MINKLTMLVVIAALVSFDQWTKSYLVTEDWAWHESTLPPWPLFMLVILVGAVAFLIPRMRIPSAICIAGVIGNGISIMAGDVANPLQVNTGAGIVAFNMADVYLYAAVIGMVIAAGYCLIPRRMV